MNMVMSEPPVMLEHVDEVTESSLNVGGSEPAIAKKTPSGPDVYFHMKSMLENSK